jgi:hypothetical protein
VTPAITAIITVPKVVRNSYELAIA